MHFLEDETGDGFSKIVSVAEVVIIVVWLDGNREVEVSTGVGLGLRCGSFDVVGDVCGFEVAKKGVGVLAIMEFDGGDDNVAEDEFGRRRRRSVMGGNGDLGHKGHGKSVVELIREAEGRVIGRAESSLS